MPTFAILGATGQTGVEIVKQLLPTEHKLHIYARSVDRLAAKHPNLSSHSNAKTFIGDLANASVLDDCLNGVDYILSTVAQNQNEPGCSIARRTAVAIVESLERLKKKRGAAKFRCPTLVFLSSASCDTREDHTLHMPWAVRPFYHLTYWALHHIYDDLKLATAYLQERQDWLPLIVAAPGGLVHHERVGVHLTTQPGGQSDLCPYGDLATAIIMMAQDGECVGQFVGPVVDGTVDPRSGFSLMRYLLPNLLASASPTLWRWGRPYWPA